MFGYVPHFLFWGLLSKYRYFDISMWYCELWHHMFRITSSRCLTPQEYFLWITPVMDGYKKVCGQLIMEKKHLLKFQTEVNIYLSRVAWRHSGLFFFLVRKYSIWSVSCRNIYIMVYCAKILVRYRYVLHGHHDWLFGFDQCLWSGKTMNYMKPCRFSEFLFNSARKNASWGVRAEILLTQDIASLDSCAGSFFGLAQQY